MEFYTTCLDRTFLPNLPQRIPKAFWRGSSTGHDPLSTSTLHKFYRIQLATLSEQRSEILDAGVTHYVQASFANANSV